MKLRVHDYETQEVGTKLIAIDNFHEELEELVYVLWELEPCFKNWWNHFEDIGHTVFMYGKYATFYKVFVENKSESELKIGIKMI